ncbi:MAG: phosphonoacetate hydrolase [Cohaesibacteraceae bacterium]|nr:phosphonoacetate hydrolase [Cohaesibacteraceae bacterium]
MQNKKPISVNGREYQFPNVTAIVICLDGCEPAYLEHAIADGLMPTLKRMQETQTSRLAHSVIPSFTNPNNLSIATGRPPIVHGICGNFLFDPDTGQEVMMNDVRFLRAPTIFSKFYAAGAKVAVITAKDKLRALLGAGLEFDDDRARCYSAEKSDTSTQAEHGQAKASEWLGMAQPEVYSAELSEFVFAAGVKLLQDWSPDLMYLTTTDYVQHKYAPEHPQAKAFYEMFDRYLTQLDAMNAAIVVTADHGMKPKHLADGSPAVIYVQDLFDEWLGKEEARVILPITDPYVVHHGALGSFATVYLPKEANFDDIRTKLLTHDAITHVLSKQEAVDQFELPEDRIGDMVLVSGENVCIGTSKDRHDLDALNEPLRSHGGLTEQVVPFIVNRKIEIETAPVLRNFDAFFVATAAAAL